MAESTLGPGNPGSTACLDSPRSFELQVRPRSKQTRRIDLTESELSRRGLLGALPAAAGSDPSHPPATLAWAMSDGRDHAAYAKPFNGFKLETGESVLRVVLSGPTGDGMTPGIG